MEVPVADDRVTWFGWKPSAAASSSRDQPAAWRSQARARFLDGRTDLGIGVASSGRFSRFE
jgi:hypothetical protein